MREFIVKIQVYEETTIEACNSRNAEVGIPCTTTIEEAITREFSWLADSGIYLDSIIQEVK
jgi:hypothetical protein